MKSSFVLAVLTSVVVPAFCTAQEIPTVVTTSGVLHGAEQDGGKMIICRSSIRILLIFQQSSHSKELYD